MEITEVKVFPVRDKKLRAFVSIVFDGSFMVNDIKVIQGKDGFFISMPSRRKKNGRFKDIAHPLNQETRQAIEERIIAEYRRVAEGGDPAPVESAAASATGPAAPAPRESAAAEEQGAPRQSAPDPPAPLPKAPGDAAEERQREASEVDDKKSLDEVAEDHLSDSYWTT